MGERGASWPVGERSRERTIQAVEVCCDVVYVEDACRFRYASVSELGDPIQLTRVIHGRVKVQ